MIQGKTVLAIIPARGGSKGIPRKNITNLAGKPLIAWTIEEANKSKYIDRLILSSEDKEIIQVAKEWGCEAPFVRPAELAKDDTPGIEPVIHAINTLVQKYDYVVLLQPTSPLRAVADIDGCIETCLSSRAPSCVSVTEVDQHPYWMYIMDEEKILLTLLNQEVTINKRQDLPPVYILNGAVYVAETTWLQQNQSFFNSMTKGFIIPKERSVDIDNGIDMQLCEILLQNKL